MAADQSELGHARRERDEAEEAEEATRRSDERFSQAFELAPIPVTISTVGRGETFLNVNGAFLELTGYSGEEVIGKRAFDLKMWASTEDKRKLEEAGNSFRNLELQLRDKAGKLYDILLSTETIRMDGEQGLLRMFYDITERKRNEAQMHQAVQSIMNDASWFSQELIARLNHIRAGGDPETYEEVELTPRERTILRQIAEGWANEKIADDLGLQHQTVRNYISAIYNKLNVHSRIEAAIWAREHGIINK